LDPSTLKDSCSSIGDKLEKIKNHFRQDYRNQLISTIVSTFCKSKNESNIEKQKFKTRQTNSILAHQFIKEKTEKIKSDCNKQ
jgi:hypothetical protein